MGFFGETIRSIQYTGRIKERTVAQPDAPDNERRQTFEEHRDEYRFLAPVIQVEEPGRAKLKREPSTRFYQKLAEDMKKRAQPRFESAGPPSVRSRVALGDVFKYHRIGCDKLEGVASQKDEAEDEDPFYVHKLLDWADDKPQPVVKLAELSSQPGFAGSPTLCHIPLEAPTLAPPSNSEEKADLLPAQTSQTGGCTNLPEAPEVNPAPHEGVEAKPLPLVPEGPATPQVVDAEPSPPSVPSLRPSDFRALQLLGKGGQGTVLLVEHKQAGTIHALKIMAKYPESLTADDKENRLPGEKPKEGRNIGLEVRKAEKVHKRIFEEHAIMRFLALQPRNMTTCFLDLQASFHDSGNFFFLTGYATRGDLWTEIERYKATGMPDSMVLGYAAEIIHILTTLHSFSVLHRDFKPDNILIDANGHLLLADFGISRAFQLPSDARPWVKDEVAPSFKLHTHVLVKHASGSSLILSPPSPTADEPRAAHPSLHHILAAPTPDNTEAVSKANRDKAQQRRRQEEEDALLRREQLRTEIEELQQRKENLRKVVRMQLAARHMTLSVCGTPGFVAPEIYQGPAYSYGADVWAAGVIVYKMVFGKLPFGLVKKMDMQDRVKQTCLGTLDFPEDPRRPVSPALKDLLSKMLEQDPSKRPSARDLKYHPYFATIDWDAIARRDGTGPGAHARAMEKKSDKKVAVPKGGPHPSGQDHTPWIDWVAPALHDRFAAASAASDHTQAVEPVVQDTSSKATPGSIRRTKSSRLMQRCKSLWKLTPSQMDLNAAAAMG